MTCSQLKIFLKAAKCKDDILEVNIDPNGVRSMIKTATRFIEICLSSTLVPVFGNMIHQSKTKLHQCMHIESCVKQLISTIAVDSPCIQCAGLQSWSSLYASNNVKPCITTNNEHLNKIKHKK